MEQTVNNINNDGIEKKKHDTNDNTKKQYIKGLNQFK